MRCPATTEPITGGPRRARAGVGADPLGLGGERLLHRAGSAADHRAVGQRVVEQRRAAAISPRRNGGCDDRPRALLDRRVTVRAIAGSSGHVARSATAAGAWRARNTGDASPAATIGVSRNR